MRVLHAGVNKCKDVLAEGTRTRTWWARLFSLFFSIVLALFFHRFGSATFGHFAECMPHQRCDVYGFVIHSNSARYAIWIRQPGASNPNLLLNSLGRQMPLAGKSNQIKEGSRNGKLIKCSKKSTLNIWLTKKPELELRPQPDFYPFQSSNNALACISFEFTTVFGIWTGAEVTLPRPPFHAAPDLQSNKEMEIIIISHQGYRRRGSQ